MNLHVPVHVGGLDSNLLVELPIGQDRRNSANAGISGWGGSGLPKMSPVSRPTVVEEAVPSFQELGESVPSFQELGESDEMTTRLLDLAGESKLNGVLP